MFDYDSMILKTIILTTYVCILSILFVYGSNCIIIILLRGKKKKTDFYVQNNYPTVTVQLPIYNELYVAERLIRNVSNMYYPRDKLEIQVIDDSTDETTDVIYRCIEDIKCQGTNIQVLHRPTRKGYKAGALKEGMKTANGEFLAVFDADFIPDPNFLIRCIPKFSDPIVGMVQTRWSHINSEYSPLTKAISIGIDGHFQMEQGARYNAGLFLNFNGTAGIWRRKCIEESGGWQEDTLTEDLDLSYRAQLLGWKLVFLEDVASPAEIPVQINAFKRQQFRWAKGSIQCAKKLMPQVIYADIPIFKKFQALIHLTYYAVHPMMIILLLLSLPLIFIESSLYHYLQVFMIGTLGPPVMYGLSQKDLYDKWIHRLIYLPLLTIIGIGISVNNSKAVLEAIFNKKSEFQRTPKFGIEKLTDTWCENKYKLRLPGTTLIEIFLGLYGLIVIFISLDLKNYFLVPFLFLYSFGYFYMSALTILHSK